MITIYEGSILDCNVDAIVNPANSHLRHSGGLARIIADAACGNHETGEVNEDWERDHLNAPLIPTGGAHVTSAGELPFKGVIHAVGPIWGGGDYCEPDLLELAYEHAFSCAQERGWSSVAVPAISCGIFGYPVEEAAPTAIEVARWYPEIDVTFALMEDEHVDAYRKALG